VLAARSQHREVRGFQGKRFNMAIRARARAPDGALLGGWLEDERFSSASELKADEHGPALCDNKIDGFYFGVGHPSATSRTDDHMRRQTHPAAGPVVDKRSRKTPTSKATIPGG